MIDDMLLSIGKAAKIIGVEIHTLREWDSQHVFCATQTSGTHRRYRLGDCLDFKKQLEEIREIKKKWIFN